jgi:hypothetical protein
VLPGFGFAAFNITMITPPLVFHVCVDRLAWCPGCCCRCRRPPSEATTPRPTHSTRLFSSGRLFKTVWISQVVPSILNTEWGGWGGSKDNRCRLTSGLPGAAEPRYPRRYSPSAWPLTNLTRAEHRRTIENTQIAANWQVCLRDADQVAGGQPLVPPRAGLPERDAQGR